MNDDLDIRLASLLMTGAPPRRDALFRIRVLERREHERYRRQRAALLAGAAAVVALHLTALALAPDAITAAIGALLTLAGLGAAVISGAATLRVVRALRR